VTAERVVPSRVESRMWQIKETLMVPGPDTDVPGKDWEISPTSLTVTYSYAEGTGSWSPWHWKVYGPRLDESGDIVEDSEEYVYGDTDYAYPSEAAMCSEEDEDEEFWQRPPQWILQLAADRAKLLPTPPSFPGVGP
jgi:hypothetical protein